MLISKARVPECELPPGGQCRITGKITGNIFFRLRNAAWIAGFRDRHAQEQGINRE
jgi:hypothetical protein